MRRLEPTCSLPSTIFPLSIQLKIHPAFYNVPHSCIRRYIPNKQEPSAGYLSVFQILRTSPRKKASFCLRVQSLRICFATVGEQLEHSPQAPPPQSPLLYTPTQNGCRHAPNPTPGIQSDFSVTLYFPKTNGFCLLLFEELCSHLMHVCAMLRLRGQSA